MEVTVLPSACIGSCLQHVHVSVYLTHSMLVGSGDVGTEFLLRHCGVVLQVLSVVAQQLLTIQNALRANLDKFWFEGRPIKLQQTCGVFSECRCHQLGFCVSSQHGTHNSATHLGFEDCTVKALHTSKYSSIG